MSIHTPGPWRRAGGMVDGYSIIGADNSVIVDGSISSPDAQLIAAAPELLEQLKLAHRMLLQTNWIHEDEAMNELLAVIRKAEGI